MSTVLLPVIFTAVMLCACYNALNFCYSRRYTPRYADNANQRRRKTHSNVRPNMKSSRIKVRRR